MEKIIEKINDDYWSRTLGVVLTEEQKLAGEKAYEPVKNKIIKIIKKHMSSPNSKIVDLGGGDGSFSQFAQNPDLKNVLVVDASNVALKKAEKRGLKTLLADLNEPLEFSDKSFDGILSIEVVEHLLKPIDFLKEAKRILKPGGTFILAFPHSSIIKDILVEIVNHDNHFCSPHQMHIFFPRTSWMKKKLSEIGFELKAEYRAGRFWPFNNVAILVLTR